MRGHNTLPGNERVTEFVDPPPRRGRSIAIDHGRHEVSDTAVGLLGRLMASPREVASAAIEGIRGHSTSRIPSHPRGVPTAMATSSPVKRVSIRRW